MAVSPFHLMSDYDKRLFFTSRPCPPILTGTLEADVVVLKR